MMGASSFYSGISWVSSPVFLPSSPGHRKQFYHAGLVFLYLELSYASSTKLQIVALYKTRIP